MYESHFGLSASPFQLNPDPGFYFDSKGHGNALAYLRYGAYQGEGFIVVTGEIGAGKTTLVRTLLSELDTRKITAAQVVSTQLEAGDLLRSILAAFGVPSTSTSKAGLISSLEAFLTVLATKGQRALLIVDEAQNLNQQAVEELRMLSNFQFDRHALLQSFLVGQPDLRELLQSKSMEQLRQRVIASCHLGPLDVAEARDYVEHRLRHVGWQQRPRFDPEAFESIHRFSGGIPRRINLLCNRLLLSAYLVGDDEITATTVERVGEEIRVEIGETTRRPVTAARAARRPAEDRIVRRYRQPGSTPEEPLLCIVETTIELLGARALADCLERADPRFGLACVAPHEAGRLADAETSAPHLAAAPVEIHLGVPRTGDAAALAAMLLGFDAVLDDLRPRAVLVTGDGDAALAASLAAHKRNVPLMHLDAGRLRAGPSASRAANGPLIDRLASLIVTDRVSAHATLAREGVPAERVLCLGTLVDDAMNALRDGAPAASEVVSKYSAATPPATSFGVLTARIGDGSSLEETTAFLGKMKGRQPLFWLVDEATDQALRSAALWPALDAARVVLLPCLPVGEAVALLREASWLVCDEDRELGQAAEALGVPCVQLQTAAQAAKAVRAIETVRQTAAGTGASRRDGSAATRIAEQIVQWLGD